MANEPEINLNFTNGCGDCGQRRVQLPVALPHIGDDFDWDIRDYDGYRLFMLEELAARFPERRQWTPADMEVVLVEVLAVYLDQLSDMLDRIQAESYLETARRPDTVRRLLNMIGYDARKHAGEEINTDHELEQLWRYYPHLMQEAKHKGVASVHQQRRMVTLADYRSQLLAHPLVLDVDAYAKWTGSWHTHIVVVRLINNLLLDDVLDKNKIVDDADNVDEVFELFEKGLDLFYQMQEIDNVPSILGHTGRYLLMDVVDHQRMVGQEVLLNDAYLVGIILAISIKVAQDYFQSEINHAAQEVLIDSVEGFFAPGKLAFGEDVVASDLIEVLMTLDGVETVCINRLKRVGSIYPDQSGSGRIVLQGHEVAVLENDPTRPHLGSLRITLHGGKSG